MSTPQTLGSEYSSTYYALTPIAQKIECLKCSKANLFYAKATSFILYLN